MPQRKYKYSRYIMVSCILAFTASWVFSTERSIGYRFPWGDLGVGTGYMKVGWFGKNIPNDWNVPMGVILNEPSPKPRNWGCTWIVTSTYGGGGRCYYIPLWLPTSVLIIALVAIQLTQGKPIAFACPNCSYNLRGNTSGKCPECGTEFDPTILTESKHNTA